MPESYSSGRDPRRTSGERPVRSAARSGSAPRSGSARPQSARPAASRSGASRPAASRSGARPQGSRPAGNRAPQGRRPAPRRKKRTQPRFFIILAAIAVILIVALIFIFGGKDGGDATVQPTSAPIANTGAENTAAAGSADPAAAANANPSTLADWLGDEDSDIAPLAEADLVKVDDLSINTSLPKDWTNILLLGTDQRTLTESSRTDAMIICSINPSTGEVKLSSIMRDLAVELNDIGQYNGTYRINSASYFGGPEYAIKIVNECFDLNIEHYVMVNFFGFQKIAQALGGIEMDITEAEMNEINKNAVQQGWIGYYAGVDESDQINEYLTSFGANTHLNGRQALAYARIRSIDSDFSRSDRQRKVLVKLMEKLKGKSAADIMMLAASLSDNVSTNMTLDKIVEIAVKVLNSGLSDVDMLRLPLNNTYVQERRNEHEMFYDCDWAANALELYNFIYE